MTYADAGVDLRAAEENVRRISQHVRSTHGPRNDMERRRDEVLDLIRS